MVNYFIRVEGSGVEASWLRLRFYNREGLPVSMVNVGALNKVVTAGGINPSAVKAELVGTDDGRPWGEYFLVDYEGGNVRPVGDGGLYYFELRQKSGGGNAPAPTAAPTLIPEPH